MIFNMDKCGGCRTCEIVCSFHHTGKFIPKKSSIKIIDNKEEPGYKVLISENDSKDCYPCDACANIDEPLCLQVCKEKEELKMMINKVKRIRDSNI